MRVKMISISASPDGVRQPGDVVEVDAKEGKALIEGGYAERVDEPKKGKAKSDGAEGETPNEGADDSKTDDTKTDGDPT